MKLSTARLGKDSIAGSLARPGHDEVKSYTDEHRWHRVRVADLALTTNGQLLAGQAADLKAAGLRRVNISLDSLRTESYSSLTGGGDLTSTIAGIEAALETGFRPVKLNTFVLRGYNDGEVVRLARFALDRGCTIRFLELMPIGCARAIFDDCFVSSRDVRERLADAFDLAPLAATLDGGSRYYSAADHAGP